MSESSSDKTKRKLVKLVKELEPKYATSIFLTNYRDMEDVLELYSKVRTPVARKHKDQAIIFYLRTCNAYKSYIDSSPLFSKGGLIRMPQIQMFSKKLLKEDWISDYVGVKLGFNVNVVRKGFDIDDWINSVKTQKPLNLKAVIHSDTPIRRYNVVNKSQLKPNE